MNSLKCLKKNNFSNIMSLQKLLIDNILYNVQYMNDLNMITICIHCFFRGNWRTNSEAAENWNGCNLHTLQVYPVGQIGALGRPVLACRPYV